MNPNQLAHQLRRLEDHFPVGEWHYNKESKCLLKGNDKIASNIEEKHAQTLIFILSNTGGVARTIEDMYISLVNVTQHNHLLHTQLEEGECPPPTD